MKQRVKISILILSICLLIPIFSIVSEAASGSVSITDKSATVGSTVTVTCTVKCSTGAIGYADVNLRYDPSALQYVSGSGGYHLNGGSGSVVYKGLTTDGTATSLSFTMNFKILKTGAHKITVESTDVRDIDEVQFTPSVSNGTITGKAPASNPPGNGGGTTTTPQPSKDSNNQLSSLQVNPGSLSPSFAAGTTTYNVNVPENTKEVTISATAQSSKATVTVSGGKDLKLGENQAQVVVIAENGASRAYNINIICGQVEEIVIGGTTNTIDENFTDDQIPTGFSRTKITYNGRQYEGLVSASGNLNLIHLQNEAGTNYYIYDQETQEFFAFMQIAIAEGKSIIPLPLKNRPEIFSNPETVSITVQGQNFDAWKLDDEFSVLYVLNQDGAEVPYRYDSVDGVFQRYMDVSVETSKDDKDQEGQAGFPNKSYMYAILGLGALTVVLFIMVICLAVKKKGEPESRKQKAIRRIEKKRAKEQKKLEKRKVREE